MKETMLPVHLIVNVYNGEKYLAGTLQSLVSQDYPQTTIHCFDNHSTDKTSQIISEFKAKYPIILSYVTPEHVTIVEGRLFALAQVLSLQKEPFYFGFCDADDLWSPNWVSTLMAFSGNRYDLLICNGYALEDEKTLPVNSCLSLSVPTPFSCPVSIQSCLFSSSVVQGDAPLFDTRFPIAYDTEFWLRRGGSMSYAHVSDRLYYYRNHPDSMCRKSFFPIFRERWVMRKLHNLSFIRFVLGFLRQLRTMIWVSR